MLVRHTACLGLMLLGLSLGLGCARDNPSFGLMGNGSGSEGAYDDTSDTAAHTGATTLPGSDDDDDDDAETQGGTGSPGCSDDSDCRDGVYCNGKETCDPGNAAADAEGCVPGPGVPCLTAGEECNEELDICVGRCRGNPDADGDGEESVACGGTDCNDDDEDINSSAEELCDGEGVDEDCDPLTTDEALIGTKAHCSECGDACLREAECVDGQCVGPRRVFLTSETFNGALGGAAGGDQACQDLADEARLGGEWLAFLIDPGSGLSRHSELGGPFRRLDGEVIANDWGDLTDESIMAPLNVTETGAGARGNAWTGFINVGGALNNNCNGWTYGGDNCLTMGVCGGAGESGTTDDHWDGHFIFDCSSQYRLYCIEQ